MPDAKVVFLHGLHQRIVEAIISFNPAGFTTLVVDGKTPEEQQIEAVKSADFIMVFRAKITDRDTALGRKGPLGSAALRRLRQHEPQAPARAEHTVRQQRRGELLGGRRSRRPGDADPLPASDSGRPGREGRALERRHRRHEHLRDGEQSGGRAWVRQYRPEGRPAGPGFRRDRPVLRQVSTLTRARAGAEGQSGYRWRSCSALRTSSPVTPPLPGTRATSSTASASPR